MLCFSVLLAALPTLVMLVRILLCTINDTCKNAQVVTSLQTSCNKSVHKLSTSCVCNACSLFVVTSC